MRAYFCEYGIWAGTDSLWHGLGLEGRMGQARSMKGPGPFVISMAGTGGKTSTIYRLAWGAVRHGLKVLVVATTHIARPGAFGTFEGNAEGIKAILGCYGLVVAGRLAEKGKIMFTGQELYGGACSLADLVLVGADSSRRLPLKVPKAGEPMIPDNTNMILRLNGLSSLEKRAEDYCLKLEEVKALMDHHGRRHYEDNRKPRGSAADGLGRNPENRADWVVQKENMMTLIDHGYLLPLRADYPRADVLPVFNQADIPQEATLAGEILEGMGEASEATSGQLDQGVSARLF